MTEERNSIERIDPDEKKLAEVHKHVFGLILIYVQTIVGMIAAAAILFVIIPSLMQDTAQAIFIATLLAILLLGLAGVIVAIATFLYRQNRIIITDRNVTQILQFGLFARKVSQLNIANVEDVTALQAGFVQTMLNFGTLTIETAGEQANFAFPYCPNCGEVAKIILDSRERMLGQMDETGEALSDIKTTYDLKNKVRQRSKKGKVSKDDTRHVQLRGIGAEVIERAHEPPDND